MNQPQQPRTAAGTVAEYEAWYAAGEDLDGADATEAAEAAAALADLFARAERGGADLHDPDAELLRWLTRDLARDDDLDGDDYDVRIRALTRYLLFLRRNRRWRRSERAIRECWDVFDWATQSPFGLETLGSTVDETVAAVLADVPTPGEVLAAAFERGFVVPLRRTLDGVAAGQVTTRAAMAEAAGVPEGSVALDLWVLALDEAALVREEPETGEITAGRDVVEAGGCPPLTPDLVGAVLMGLVRAAVDRAFTADAESASETFPRGVATLIALVVATDDEYVVAADADDTEESTADVVALFVGRMAGDLDDATQHAHVAEVMAAVEALAELGVVDRTVLERGSVAYLAPAPFRHRVMRTIADYTGLVGTPDDVAGWSPVRQVSALPRPAGVELVLTLRGEAVVTRRVRVLAALPLSLLHAIVQRAFGWRDLRVHVFSDAGGVRRATHAGLLGRFDAEADAAVVDSQAVQIGAVLGAAGDRVVYSYGSLTDPWEVGIEVADVLDGVEKAVEPVGGEGEPPAEPTVIGEALAPLLPPGMVVPAGLEQAWAFMESRGWRSTAAGEHLLSPNDGSAAAGIVFETGLGLGGFVPEGSPAAARLLPIGRTAGDGSVAALWLDDDGETRVVGLGSEGEAYVLAESGFEMLRLVAVGYDELTHVTLGAPPDLASREATEPFRAWVRDDVGLDVPGEWPAVGRDRFTAWVERARGQEPARPAEVPTSSTTVSGEITTVLAALGLPDSEGLADLARLVGVEPVEGGLRRAGAALRAAGIEVSFADGVLETVFLDFSPSGYARTDALIDGLDEEATAEQVLSVLGEPEARGEGWVRYVVDGRYLHLQLASDGIALVTAMASAPGV